MKYVYIALGLVVIGAAAFLWYITGPESFGRAVLCDGKVVLSAESPRIRDEGGRHYFVKALLMDGSREKEIFSVYDARPDEYGSGEYLPLPLNTSIPVVAIEKPSGSGEPPLVNVFIDPSKVSRSEFDEIGDCLKENSNTMNVLLADTPQMGSQGSIVRFGGMAYATARSVRNLVRSVNTDPPTLRSEGEFPLVNEVGAIVINTSYVGDIFNGVTGQEEYERGSLIPLADMGKNSLGENIYQYAARLQKELKAR